jgi:6-phosphogluconolactonase
MARVTIVPAASLAETAAAHIAQLIDTAVAARGHANVSLTGGHTPEQTYSVLADPLRPYRQRIDWSHVHLYWGDERHVPPDHPDSNFGMADRTLVRHVPIPGDHVHRVQAERADPHDAAAAYARELPDTFDVMLLGLGEDCHIASIFPGSELLDDGRSGAAGSKPVDRRTHALNPGVVAVFAPHLDAWRITMTPSVILDSHAIVMLVGGKGKAAAVAAAIDAPLDVVRYPGQLLRKAEERVEWILDEAAASALRG